MHWIIQKDILAKSLNLDLTYALERLGISYTEVDVHHYQTSPVIDCEVINEPIMTNGSIMLSKIAHSNNWFSGHAGIYDADLIKIIHALDSMPVNKKTYKNKN